MEWTTHELNTDFAWQPTRGPFRRVNVEQAASYDEQGFFLLEDAFDAEVVREVIEDNVSGLVTPPRDSAALAAALKKMISDSCSRSYFCIYYG